MPLRHIARMVIRHPAGTLAGLAALALWGAVAVNALTLQSGPHPAPLLGADDRETAALPMTDVDGTATAERQAAEDRRALIRELQELLAERGFYEGEIDGLAGPLTEEAIRAFETAAGLEVTGSPRAALLAHIELSPHSVQDGPTETAADAAPADPETEGETAKESELDTVSTLTESDRAIERPSSGAADVDPEEGDPEIAAVQRVLADLGYAPGLIDGHLGPQTQAAIRRFQRDRGLEPTGELDEALLDELESVSGMSLG